MDFNYEANIVRALGLMIKNGHLQQGFKPVHWCIDCGSALAEAEVDYEEKTSTSIDVAFVALKPEEFINCFKTNSAVKPLSLPIWTTTPWTLPANEAVCLHPEIDYSLIDAGESYFVLATDLVESAMERYGISHYKTSGSAKGKVFEGLKLKHPFYARQVPVILGEHVTTETGTGSVHTAPAHGPDDYMVGKAYNLALVNPVKANGCFAEDVELFAGISVLKADAPILEVLAEKGVLLAKSTIRHSYPQHPQYNHELILFYKEQRHTSPMM